LPVSDARGERILLILPAALGDLILAFRAFGRIRRSFPDAHLALLVGEPFEEMVRLSGFFDEVLAFDAEMAYGGGAAGRVRLLGALARRVRRLRPTRVGVFKGAPVWAALALASGARVRVGLTRGVGRLLLTAPLAVDRNRHREDRNLDVARLLGAGEEDGADAAWPAVPLPAEVGGGDAGPWIGMTPGGARNVKEEMAVRRWAPERYAELAARLLEREPRARFVFLGGPGDREEAERVMGSLPSGTVVDLVGRTTVAEVRETIARLDAFVGHDSGLMHVAGTTGTPMVAIFGPTDARVLCPRGPQARYVWHPSQPTPCYDEVDGTLRPCAPGCCTTRVTVDEVFARTLDALAMHRAGASGPVVSAP
jgi:ADP-heptose:LPS heptosyltransferase